ncbi:MAG: SGNH/GDSL hydrolase family protein [Lachnospiraceae bacterium]|nr:SGNH/GDSL hydrolase family protein [Lachnospiraceae bacterium]
MKKILKMAVVSLLCMGLLFTGLNLTSVDAYSAGKNTKKTTKKTASITQEEEVVLAQLTAYLDMLVKMGAPESEIVKTQDAIKKQQDLIAYKKANAEMILKQQEALANLQKTLEKGAKTSPLGVIFVGDSRTCQMHDAVGDTGAYFIAEYAQGYKWFTETALPKIDALVMKGSKVVINLGVNDLNNIDNYINTVNNWAYVWRQRGATVYYATVNPIWDNEVKTNAQVVEFNRKLMNGLVGVKIIDSNTFLTMSGYKLVDNWHYDAATYGKIYYYLLSQL